MGAGFSRTITSGIFTSAILGGSGFGSDGCTTTGFGGGGATSGFGWITGFGGGGAL